MEFQTITIIFTALLTVFCTGDYPCNKRATQYGYICVCNSTYCDSISPPKRVSKGLFHVYYTSNNSAGFNHETGSFGHPGIIPHGQIYEVNISQTYQKIRGFGATFSDSFGFAYNLLSEDCQDKLIRSFYGEDGLQYSISRVCLGSSDFSLRQYTYVPEYDPMLKSFSLTEDDYLYKIPQIQKALKVSQRPISLLGTTWTPPVWMKVNKKTSSGFLRQELRQVWANYYIKILEAFRKEGIEFWGFTTGNEPITLYQFRGIDIPNLAMLPEEQRDWVIQNLGPTLRNANYSTKVILLDDQRIYGLWWMNTVLRDERANTYVHGIGLHWYFDSIVSPTTMDKIHEKYPDQEILYTESSINAVVNTEKQQRTRFETWNSKNNPGFDPPKPLLGVWKRAALYITSIIENLNHWVTTYIDWNLALDESGGPNLVNFTCDATVIVNSTIDEFYKQPIFYAMGHFSKFIQPQSTIISVRKLRRFKDSYNFNSQSYPPSPLIGPHPNRSKLIVPSTGATYPVPPSTTNQKTDLDVHFVGALNPDGSRAVIFYNPKITEVKITFHDPDRGYASLTLRPESITSTVYW